MSNEAIELNSAIDIGDAPEVPASEALPTLPGLHVYQAICAIQGRLAQIGIAKSRQNQQQNYAFRGIDQVYAALSPLLATFQLCMLPRVLSQRQVERQTKKGDPLFFTIVEVEFDFVSAIDGSQHTVRTIGEAMDSADKSTNKAESAAYKYAAVMSFGIPVEGEPDADATTPGAIEPAVDKKRDTTAAPEVAKRTNPHAAARAALAGVEVSAEDQARLRSIGNSLIDYHAQELAELGTDNGYLMYELLEPLDNDEQLWLSVFLQNQSAVRKRCKDVIVAARMEARKQAQKTQANDAEVAAAGDDTRFVEAGVVAARRARLQKAQHEIEDAARAEAFE